MNFFGMGPLEILVIALVAFIIFGPEKLSEIMGGLGKAVREFRAMTSDLTGEFERTVNEVKAEVQATAGDLQNTTREALTVEGLNPFDQPIFGIQPAAQSHSTGTANGTGNGVSPTAAPPAALQPARSQGPAPTKTDPLADFAIFGEPIPAPVAPPAAPPAAPQSEAAPEPEPAAEVVTPEVSVETEAEAQTEAGGEGAEQQERDSVTASPNGALDPAAEAA